MSNGFLEKLIASFATPPNPHLMLYAFEDWELLVLRSIKFSENFSTRLLTVLTIRDIVRIVESSKVWSGR